MVLSYAHSDRERLDRSELIVFLEGLARDQKWDFWWDEKMAYPRFDEEIRDRFENADVIICLISQAFLNSRYISSVESKTVQQRLKREEVLVVPILLTPSRWEQEQTWLTKLHHFPKQGFLHGAKGKKWAIAVEITEYISRYFKQRVFPVSDPRVVYKLRRLSETALKPEQLRILRRDACKRAAQEVPDTALRAKICKEARRRGARKNRNLGKQELAAIDRKFLARRRKPDPEKIRWVLRCAGLHPQGKAGA
ncbi:MAG TPA: TIR domain-containing protein [Chthoniobacterales bacterium]|nr:TIR domain-containing protein [Chthoniobacterales bacterium]